jgi:Domain of unknown function (DUF222)/HNH endonuclease
MMMTTDHDQAALDSAVADAADSDARHERMDRIAVLYGEITAATREFLRALAESDRHQDWAEEGFASCADWLAWRIGVTRNTASEKVRAARALEALPLISDAMARGEVSFSKVRALTRVATPESEAELLEYARASSTAGLERLVRGWKTMSRAEEQKRENLLHLTRSFSVFANERGMYEVRGRLTPEVAAVLMRAVEAASDALYRACPNDEARQESGQLRADALGLLAERALAAGFAVGSGVAGDGTGVGDDGDGAPISGSRAERYQVVLHVEPKTLAADGEPGVSELEDGTRVSAETSRRLACDCSKVEVQVGPDGSALDVGRKTRTVPPPVRRALEVRDRGCRFPGCGLRFTDAHHVEHWADGGATRLDNLILLCRRHHRLVHECGYRVSTDTEAKVVFFSPEGRAFGEAAPMPELGADPARELVRKNRERDVEPDWRTSLPGYRHDRDVPWHLEAAAWEALDREPDVRDAAAAEPDQAEAAREVADPEAEAPDQAEAA